MSSDIKKNRVNNYLSNTTIPNNTSFTSAWEDIADFPTLVCSINANRHVSLLVDFSMDGVNIYKTTDTLINQDSESIVFARIMRYMRVRVSNASGSSAVVSLQIIFGEAVGMIG